MSAESKELLAHIVSLLEALTKDVADLKVGQTTMATRIDRLEAGQAKLEEGQARLEAGQAKLEAGLAKLEAGHVDLKTGQAVLSARLDEQRSILAAMVPTRLAAIPASAA
ncbi:hypothetical protein [Azospirillum sp.]|uniref:hypothetical protein n=1 Tax=Azospirillum sp. TaxID=34012 RepID=UPI002610B7FD|nr:hypothetical protein [Azospirillum sp.]